MTNSHDKLCFSLFNILYSLVFNLITFLVKLLNFLECQAITWINYQSKNNSISLLWDKQLWQFKILLVVPQYRIMI